MIDFFDIRDHIFKISPHTVDLIRLLARTVDRAGHSPQVEFDQSFENFVADIVEVYAIASRHGDLPFVRQLENLHKPRIEKDFAVIREFDVGERGILVEESAEIFEPEEAAPDRRMD